VTLRFRNCWNLLPLLGVVAASAQACLRGLKSEFDMVLDRQLVGDVVLAMLIAIPSATLARPVCVPRHSNALPTHPQNATLALASAADRQVGMFR
jgi:hypothetical protein